MTPEEEWQARVYEILKKLRTFNVRLIEHLERGEVEFAIEMLRRHVAGLDRKLGH